VGFRKVFIGVESGSDCMLARLRKGAHTADVVRACELLDSAGIRFHTSFLHDVPEESDEDSAGTFRLAETLAQYTGNSQAHHFFCPFPGTELYRALRSRQGIDDNRLADYCEASTYGESGGYWHGRPDFRRRVLDRLNELRQKFPATTSAEAMPHSTRLGSL